MKTQDASTRIAIKRIYEPVDPVDGHRVLVDRLWPRGISRKRAALDEWTKIITPSNDLRLWFAHRSDRWQEFKIRYRLELSQPGPQIELERLADVAHNQKLTLLTAARSPTENHVRILKEMIQRMMLS